MLPLKGELKCEPSVRRALDLDIWSRQCIRDESHQDHQRAVGEGNRQPYLPPSAYGPNLHNSVGRGGVRTVPRVVCHNLGDVWATGVYILEDSDLGP